MATVMDLVTAFQWCKTCISSEADGQLKYPVHKYTYTEREKERKNEINKQTNNQKNI